MTDTERERIIFQEIVVEYPSYNTYPEYKGKPYFSIKYTENGQEFIGYGTYKPEVLSEYLKEYFMPSAQPEQPTEVQDILQYLDEYLHPIVSPEHWSVYSELYDMVSMLPSAQPDIIQCRNCKFASGDSRICMKFGHSPIGELDFCAWAERRTDG